MLTTAPLIRRQSDVVEVMLASSTTANAITRFDWILRGATAGPDKTFDIDLGNFSHAAIVPTRGALVPDWLLLVPRTPCLSFAGLDRAKRLQMMSIVDIASRAVIEQAGHAVIFEHGASRLGSLTGCGVDQGHLHIVGLPIALKDYLRSQCGDLDWRPANHSDPWADIPPNTDYLLVMAGDEAWVAQVFVPASQLLRRHVASFLSLDAQWDYKSHPKVENAQATSRKYAGVFADVRQ